MAAILANYPMRRQEKNEATFTGAAILELVVCKYKSSPEELGWQIPWPQRKKSDLSLRLLSDVRLKAISRGFKLAPEIISQILGDRGIRKRLTESRIGIERAFRFK